MVLALERWVRLDLELLVSLTNESGTIELGFRLLDLFEEVSLANESGAM